MKIGVHFSDIYGVSTDDIDSYGAFNISLINDMPLFIDPFLLFSSNKKEYGLLHQQILRYMSFLKEKAEKGITDTGLIKAWYAFPEVKQNWLGYSEHGNSGRGLGIQFANIMHTLMPAAFKDLGQEKLTETTHLEKVGLFNKGIGRDNISDFTTNLILDYLLKYTETFTQRYIDPSLSRKFTVKKAVFDYQYERWMPGVYRLPVAPNGDFVILTPKDILTRDETWINSGDMLDRFPEISESIENEQLRAHINEYFQSKIPRGNYSYKDKERFVKAAKWETLKEFPILVEYYINQKEQEKEGANSVANEKVNDVKNLFVTNIQTLLNDELSNTGFFSIHPNASYVETLKRVHYLKKCIEKNDVYKLFYVGERPVKKEQDLQLAFRLVWYATEYDINREVNNGRGPVDYKVSNGAKDSTLVEFKLASNSSLKKNLAHQLEIYETANDTRFGIKVIMYFTTSELEKVNKILRDLNIENNTNVVLIDARPKKSASKDDGNEN